MNIKQKPRSTMGGEPSKLLMTCGKIPRLAKKSFSQTGKLKMEVKVTRKENGMTLLLEGDRLIKNLRLNESMMLKI